MLTLNDGRSELWQWDTGRTVSVDADCSQVHFSNKVFGRSIDVDVLDGVAIIPDVLLQTDKELIAWAFVGTSENGYTKISKVFKVNRRNKPADYVFTPQEQVLLKDAIAIVETAKSATNGAIESAKQAEAAQEAAQVAANSAGIDASAASAAATRAEAATIRQPYPNPETGTWWAWDVEVGAYVDTGETYNGNVMFATFDMDPATGDLHMITPDGYTGPEFAINEDDYLEVRVNA